MNTSNAAEMWPCVPTGGSSEARQLVTGGGAGIGRAIAARFAASGGEVLITGRRAEPLRATARDLGATARFAVCDGTDPLAVDALRAELPGTVDVLVNNAGGNTDFDRGAADDLKTLADNWHANLASAVLMTHVVRERLTDQASVISIDSTAADKDA